MKDIYFIINTLGPEKMYKGTFGPASIDIKKQIDDNVNWEIHLGTLSKVCIEINRVSVSIYRSLSRME